MRSPITYKQINVAEKEEFALPSRLESVEEAALRTEDFARKFGFGDDFISAVNMAVRESVANAVKHGNKLDESKPVEVSLTCSGEWFEITVRDHGPGFSHEDIPDPTEPENLLKASGRGIVFMRTFMDEVEWSNHPSGGMMVKMRKKQ